MLELLQQVLVIFKLLILIMIQNIKENFFLKDLLEMLLILIWFIELNRQEKLLCLIEKEYGMKKESIINLCHDTSNKTKR